MKVTVHCTDSYMLEFELKMEGMRKQLLEQHKPFIRFIILNVVAVMYNCILQHITAQKCDFVKLQKIFLCYHSYIKHHCYCHYM